MKEKSKFKIKHPRIHLLLRTLKRIVKKDDYYVQRVLLLGEDIDLIDIEHKGDIDYGKIIYVISENAGNEGFCATLRFIVGFLMYAKQHGFAPKIRLTKEFAYYDEEKSKETDNPWEYYFLPEDEGYEEEKALNVVNAKFFQMMKIKEYPWIDAYTLDNYYNKDLFEKTAPLINKYMEIKPEILDEASMLLSAVRKNAGKILGVHYRGTDFKNGYNDHPVYIDEKQMIEEIKKALETNKFQGVFLATDDKSALDKIKDSFEKIDFLFYPDVFRNDGNRSVAFSKSDRKCHHYLLGREIVRDMYTLSLCDGLVAGKSSVSYMSNLYKHSRHEEYEYMHIIDNGNNVNEKQFEIQ